MENSTPPPTGINNPNPPLPPGSQPQPTTLPPLPGVNKPNPPSIAGQPSATPGDTSFLPVGWNQAANILQMILQVYLKDGATAANRLETWLKNELSK